LLVSIAAGIRGLFETGAYSRPGVY